MTNPPIGEAELENEHSRHKGVGLANGEVLDPRLEVGERETQEKREDHTRLRSSPEARQT